MDKYFILAYVLGTGYIIGYFAAAQFQKDEGFIPTNDSPFHCVMWYVLSPLIAVIFGLFLLGSWFFCKPDDR